MEAAPPRPWGATGCWTRCPALRADLATRAVLSPSREDRTGRAGRAGQSARIPPDSDGASGWASRIPIPAWPNAYGWPAGRCGTSDRLDHYSRPRSERGTTRQDRHPGGAWTPSSGEKSRPTRGHEPRGRMRGGIDRARATSRPAPSATIRPWCARALPSTVTSPRQMIVSPPATCLWLAHLCWHVASPVDVYSQNWRSGAALTGAREPSVPSPRVPAGS